MTYLVNTVVANRKRRCINAESCNANLLRCDCAIHHLRCDTGVSDC